MGAIAEVVVALWMLGAKAVEDFARIHPHSGQVGADAVGSIQSDPHRPILAWRRFWRVAPAVRPGFAGRCGRDRFRWSRTATPDGRYGPCRHAGSPIWRCAGRDRGR